MASSHAMFHIQYGQVVFVPREFRKNGCEGKPSKVSHIQYSWTKSLCALYINLILFLPLSGKREFREIQRVFKPSQVKSYIHGQVPICASFKFDSVSSPLRKKRIQRVNHLKWDVIFMDKSPLVPYLNLICFFPSQEKENSEKFRE